MPYSHANGVDIWYEVKGDGPAMVLVHANPFDHDLWIYQAAHFSTWFKVVGIDIRGYGRSSKVTQPYALIDMVEDVVGVMKDLKIARAVLMRLQRRLGHRDPARPRSPGTVQRHHPGRRQFSGSSDRYQGRIDGYRKEPRRLSHQASARARGAVFRRQPARPPSAQHVGRARAAAFGRSDCAGVHGRQSHRHHRALAGHDGADAGHQRRARQFAARRPAHRQPHSRRGAQGAARHRARLLHRGSGGLRPPGHRLPARTRISCQSCDAHVHRHRDRHRRNPGRASARRRVAPAQDRLQLRARLDRRGRVDRLLGRMHDGGRHRPGGWPHLVRGRCCGRNAAASPRSAAGAMARASISSGRSRSATSLADISSPGTSTGSRR